MPIKDNGPVKLALLIKCNTGKTMKYDKQTDKQMYFQCILPLFILSFFI